MPRIARLLAIVAFIPLAPTTSVAQAEAGTRVRPGLTETIDQHGVCRRVTNEGAVGVMIPHRSPEEWSIGGGSFLAAPRPDLRVEMCAGTPTASCFLWASGLAPGTRNDLSMATARIGNTSFTWPGLFFPGGSDMIGAGDYPDPLGSASDPGPFFRASSGTFDGVAIGRDTRVIIYEGKNFSGRVLADISGPAVRANRLFTELSGEAGDYFRNSWRTEDWSSEGNLIQQFTPVTRRFVDPVDGEPGMFAWAQGSVRVICE